MDDWLEDWNHWQQRARGEIQAAARIPPSQRDVLTYPGRIYLHAPPVFYDCWMIQPKPEVAAWWDPENPRMEP